MSSFEAIVFDYDGTLGDTQKLHEPSRDHAFEVMHAKTRDARYINIPREVHKEAHKHGSSPFTIIGWVLQQAEIVPADTDLYSHPTVAEVVAHKDEAYRELVRAGADAFPGAIPLIRRIHAERVGAQGIATTARLEQELMPFMVRHGIADMFPEERVMSRESVTNLKPHPEIYLGMLEVLGLQNRPTDMLVVEDSAHGMEAARLAGVTVAGVAHTLTLEEIGQLPERQTPDIILADLHSLDAMIDTSFK